MGSRCKRLVQSFLNFLFLFVLGAISSLIFPPFQDALFGYMALILFLCLLLGNEHTHKELFKKAYVFGIGAYVVGFSWINNALLTDGGAMIGFVPIVVLAIGLFFGLFWAIPMVVVGKIKNIYARMLIFSVAFVFMEWVRSFIFTGFPWNLLGSALSFNTHLIQGAAYIGTYGLSLMLLLVCLGISLLILSLVRKQFYYGCLLFLFFPFLFFASVYNNTEIKKCTHCDEMNDFIVRLVQPSIPQTFKWNPEFMQDNFLQYIKLTQKGTKENQLPLNAISLVVWGETATPYFLDRDEVHLQEIKKAIPYGGFLITGVLRLAMESGEVVPYNSLFVLDDEGNIKDYYDKSHLVPFGEFLPFRDYLPSFMKPVADIVGTLGRGEKYKLIRVTGLPLMAGAICYESIFPKEVINPHEKPEILIVLANDGWYGVSAGPYQHLAASVMRAVEEGVTVIRSANTGISAVITPRGEILGQTRLNDVDVIDVSLVQPLSYQTFYGCYGNSVVFLILLFVFLIAGALEFLAVKQNKK